MSFKVAAMPESLSINNKTQIKTILPIFLPNYALSFVSFWSTLPPRNIHRRNGWFHFGSKNSFLCTRGPMPHRNSLKNLSALLIFLEVSNIWSTRNVYLLVRQLPCTGKVQKPYAGYKIFRWRRALYQNEVKKWPLNQPRKAWQILYPAWDFCTEWYGPIPFEVVLTILVSTFNLIYMWWEKREI